MRREGTSDEKSTRISFDAMNNSRESATDVTRITTPVPEDIVDLAGKSKEDSVDSDRLWEPNRDEQVLCNTPMTPTAKLKRRWREEDRTRHGSVMNGRGSANRERFTGIDIEE